ncbi:hypothetical protein PGB90_000066 [Kerria lacca]
MIYKRGALDEVSAEVSSQQRHHEVASGESKILAFVVVFPGSEGVTQWRKTRVFPQGRAP